MKTIYKHSLMTSLVCLLLTSAAMVAQVGIGDFSSTTPRGVLDVQDSGNAMGIVFPVVALVDATTETVVNPNGANIVPGTTVYNTTVLDDGPDSLYPGIFTWKGSKWTSLRERKDNALFLQDTDVRTGSSDILNPVAGKQTIPFDSNSFTPIYTGRYALHLVVHYGGGNLDASAMSSSQFVNFAKEEGEFEFIFNGNTYNVDISSYSTYNNDSDFNGGSLRVSTNRFNQIGYDYVEVLTAGTTYTFSLTFNQADAQGFEGDGDIVASDDGRGYVTINDNIKCYLEINYVYE